MEHPSGHFALKRLVQMVPEFAEGLVEKLGESLSQWAANNRGAFVVVALLEREETRSKAKVHPELGDHCHSQPCRSICSSL